MTEVKTSAHSGGSHRLTPSFREYAGGFYLNVHYFDNPKFTCFIATYNIETINMKFAFKN